jgi:hypothetical protein
MNLNNENIRLYLLVLFLLCSWLSPSNKYTANNIVYSVPSILKNQRLQASINANDLVPRLRLYVSQAKTPSVSYY